MTDFRGGNLTGHVARAYSKPAYTITRTIDCAVTPLAQGTHQFFAIPEDTRVIDVTLEVISAETVGASGTLAIGYTGSATAFIAANTVAATGYNTSVNTGVKSPAYAVNTNVVLGTVATADLEDAVLKISATFLDVSA